MSENLFSPIDSKPKIPVGQIVLGSVLIVIGLGWLLSALDIASIPWRALLAAVLIVIGIALAAAASRGVDADGLISAGTTLVVVLALLSTAAAAFSVPLTGGVGEREYNPTTTGLREEYRLIAGELDIDLSGVDFPERETRLEASVMFGKLVIDGIPAGVAVSVESSVAAGEMIVFGSVWDGVSLDEQTTDANYNQAARRLFIDASVGFGQIEVRR